MAKKEGYSRPGLSGEINHYDADGYRVGHSDFGSFGDWNHYWPE